MAIRPFRTVYAVAPRILPSRSATVPGAPLTIAGRTRGRNSRPCVTTRSTTCSGPVAASTSARGSPSPVWTRTTTSGSSTARRPSRSPARAAARKASTTSRWLSSRLGGRACAPHPPAGAARELPGGLGERRRSGAISSNGTANMSCSTNASARQGQRLEHDEQREPDRVGQQRLVLGIGAVGGLTIGSGTWAPIGSSRRDLRERSMSSQPGRRPSSARPEVLDLVGRSGSGAARRPGPRRRPRQRAEHPIGHRP